VATAHNAGTILCAKCGTPAAAGRKFCKKCGAALTAQPAAVAPAAPAPKPVAKAARPTAAKKKGLSIWWVAAPTLLFAYLSRDPVQIAIVAALGAGLWVARTKQIPPTADNNLRALEPYLPYAPAFQIVVVFVMVGGNIIVVAMITAAVIAAARYRRQIVAALEPWWQIQSSIPSTIRKPLAILAAGFVGYYFGRRAGGREWTYTLISISFGIAVAFLIIFTPPDSLRPTKRE